MLRQSAIEAVNRLSLRARIVLWILLLFLIIQITLSLVVLLYARQDVRRSLQRSLTDFGSLVHSQVSRWDAIPTRDTFEVALSDAIPSNFNELYGVIITYESDSGETRRLQSGPLGDELLAMVEARATRRATERGRLGGVGFLVSKEVSRVPLRGGGTVSVLVALNSTDAVDSVALIAKVLLVSLPVSATSLGIAAWVVAGIAVRPLQQVEEFAIQLSPENIGKPVELEAGGTEVDSLQTELRDAMDRMDQAYQEQARFLANISHEIKTPISIVLAEAEVLLMKPQDPGDVKKFVKSTAEEMRRLGSMVESFLLLTRVEAGKSRVRRKPLDLNELLMDAVEQCHGMASLHTVTLTPHLCDHDKPPSVLGNADLLATAIGNLIRNAIRFTPTGESVEVTCDVDPDDDYGIIRIRDHGPGIPDELLPRLFEPFTQASDERRRGRGTGLGLQIAKGIAELHEGDIKAENLDKGCQFSLSLPQNT